MAGKAGFAYFATTFAIGFALGTLRVLALRPALGDVVATLLELPIILALAWWLCGWLVQRFTVPESSTARLAMGGIALGLLLLGEIGISIIGFGRSLGEHIAVYRSPAPAIGLLGQLVFALFPLIQLLRAPSQTRP